MNCELSNRKNKFFQKYDYGKGIVGFDEYVLRIVSSCPLGCKYCYLQDVNKRKQPKIYTNFEQLRQEFKELISNASGPMRINAGENADSLVFEPKAGVVDFLDGLLTGAGDVQIELRTKTSNVEFLKSLKNKDKFTVVFTISPENVIKKLEKKTASLNNRLEAAKKCQEMGINVGLRFEPIINSKTLVADYTKTIDLIKQKLDTAKLQPLGLSCLRLTKGLMQKLQKSAPELLLEEFVPCPDGKFRYFRPIRTGIYCQLIDIIKDRLPGVKVFLSTEPEYVWRDCGLKTS